LGTKYNFDNIIGAAACFGEACLCKESSAVIPGVMAIGDLAPMMLSSSKKQKDYFAAVARASIMAVLALGHISFHSYIFAGKRGGLSDLRVYDAFVFYISEHSTSCAPHYTYRRNISSYLSGPPAFLVTTVLG
jgi:hypothetical protein